jgi:hypothetical protein
MDGRANIEMTGVQHKIIDLRLEEKHNNAKMMIQFSSKPFLLPMNTHYRCQNHGELPPTERGKGTFMCIQFLIQFSAKSLL